MDQFPESRSIVFKEVFPGDFSAGGGAVLVMLAVRVDIDGSVCVEDTGGVCGPVEAGSHGRWVSVASMTKRKITVQRV